MPFRTTARASVPSAEPFIRQFFRYMVSSGIVFSLGLAQYSLFYACIPLRDCRSSAAWSVHFLVGTLWTHALHRWFTFKHVNRRSYASSLLRTYAGYAGTQIIGAGIMLWCCDLHHWNHTGVWIALNIVLSAFMFPFLRGVALGKVIRSN